jgi:hypothetical protein
MFLNFKDYQPPEIRKAPSVESMKRLAVKAPFGELRYKARTL